MDLDKFNYECQGQINMFDLTMPMISITNKIRLIELFAGYNNGWISCSERLPEEPKPNPLFENKPLEFYMVTEKGATYPFRAFWNGKAFTDGWSKLDIIAWQPLPAPYKPKED